MKNFKLSSILIAAMVITMLVSSCTAFRRVVTTPVVPELSIMEEVVVLEEVTVTKIKESIMFLYDSATIQESEVIKIEKINALLTDYPDTMIVLKGFASKEGTSDYNLILSENRAKAVAASLILRGIDADRIEVLAPGATEDFGSLLELNRRVIVLDIK